MASEVIRPLAFRSEIVEQWQWHKLEDVCEGIFDCPHSTPLLTDSGPYVARSQDIRTGVFKLDLAGRVSEEIYKDRIARAEPKHGDLLFSREGTYFGIAAEVPPNIRVCLGQRMVLIRPDADRLNFRFLRYWLNSQMMVDHMHGFRDGTVAERLNMPTIRRLPVVVPPFPIQEDIATTLGTLDDKIELNRRMNATLEQMAQALFKSWFVDFDPVKAKAEGRAPEGMDADTAALFPSEFEERELGLIPKGWERKPLQKCIDFLEGPGIRNWQYTNSEEGTRFINIRCIKDGDIVLDTASRVRDEEAFGRYRHFLLEERDLVVSTSGTLGRYAIVRAEHLPLMLNTSVIRMRPLLGLTSHCYVYGYIESNEFQNEINLRASGSVQKNFGPMHLKQMTVLLPPYRIIEAHSKIAKSIFDKRLQNLSENERLNDLRGALLPRLISGQLRIPDIEQAEGGV